MIEVKNLVKRYSGRNVVDNLSFTVEKGQIVGFLGPNGAGKSTTMNIILTNISGPSRQKKSRRLTKNIWSFSKNIL